MMRSRPSACCGASSEDPALWQRLTPFLRRDAGCSLNTIDDQVQQLGEDVAFISELLVIDV